MKTYMVLLLSALVTFSLVGCNAIKGAGEDMQKGGQKVSQTAEDHGAS